MSYKIVNLVASTDLGLEIDLHQVAEKLRNSEYEPEQFPGAILKLTQPKATILVFKNGKIVIVGCKTKKDIESAIKLAYDQLKKVSTKIRKRMKKIPYQITNIVALADLKTDLNLFEIVEELEANVEYEPEQFPGTILKLDKPKVTVLVFKNGKLIIAGSKSEEEVKEAIKKVKKLLKPFIRK
ncbi:MAG: TATA-box-binding protein [Candidatus Micrarchaeota archaeon]|nr:TATA-box-binding protein [Candidatus Micrarchaeota archaeon]